MVGSTKFHIHADLHKKYEIPSVLSHWMAHIHNQTVRRFIVAIFVAVVLSSLAFNLYSTHSGNSSDHGSGTGSSALAVETAVVNHTGIPSAKGGFGHINPTALYSSEPAPMGITDFGYTSQTGPYSYNSTSFIGIVHLGSLYAYNDSSGSNGSSFQMNLVLNFVFAGQTYYFWVQDVAAVNTSTTGQQYMTFIDNVWNFSSNYIYSTTLSGNGTVSQNTFYYDIASSLLPGNQITLSAPITVELKAVSSVTSSGIPAVKMMYNDGNGWVTYDNILFSFARGVSSDSGFYVNGYSSNPVGLYNDAELIIGGPGSGSSTIMQSGNVSMSLQYWNGHNYQAVPTAWNFGSDTAEAISNTSTAFAGSVDNGSLSSVLTPGSGSPGVLYSTASTSTINISTPFLSGTAHINNAAVNFTQYGINLTLPAGTYNISLTPSSGGRELVGTFYAGAGKYLKLNDASFSQKYRVVLHEHGLPSGTGWEVIFQNGTYSGSSNTTITLYLSNGTYVLTGNTSDPYAYNVTGLTITVNGVNFTQDVNFTRLYMVTFMESGLVGVEWFVNLSSVMEYNLSGPITFLVQNGTYNFTVTPVANYHVSPSTGVVTVNGTDVYRTIVFVQEIYGIRITETGLSNGTDWSIFINGNWHYSNNTTMLLYLSNGSYAYIASGLKGSFITSGNRTIVVSGSNETVVVNFKSAYNSGLNLDTKLVYAAFVASITVAGAVALRRR